MKSAWNYKIIWPRNECCLNWKLLRALKAFTKCVNWRTEGSVIPGDANTLLYSETGRRRALFWKGGGGGLRGGKN